jgi:hypothetical protein
MVKENEKLRDAKRICSEKSAKVPERIEKVEKEILEKSN